MSAKEALEVKRARARALLQKRTASGQASFAQERLWFLEQLWPDTGVYNMPFGLRLKGRLARTALKRALAEIVRRHEVLRARFVLDDAGRVRQEVTEPFAFPLTIGSLLSLDQGAREREVRRLAEEDARAPFDLRAGPLVRATLLLLGEQDHVLLFSMHHAVSDGWSMGIFVRELGILYDAFTRDAGSPLPDLPLQYSDYAAWQRQWIGQDALAEQLAYWKTQWKNPPPPADLPTDRPRPAVQSFRGGTLPLRLSRELSRALVETSRREDVSLFMVLLAGFQIFLSRYSGQADVAVGVPVGNRPRSEFADLIGLFVNTLAVRIDVDERRSFNDFLSDVRRCMLAAYEHQDAPFEQVVEAVAPARDMSRAPLFQHLFTFQNAPFGAFRLPELEVEMLPTPGGVAKFDLSLSLVEDGDGIAGSVEYCSDLFDAATVERMMMHFRTLLEGLARRPVLPLGRHPLLANDERERYVALLRRPKGAHLLTVVEAFRRQVERTPDAVAVTSCHIGPADIRRRVSWSYRELHDRSRRLARHLRSLGTGSESRVGVCLRREPSLVVAVLAILEAGAAYVPLDPGYPRERLEYLVEDSGIAMAIVSEATRASLPFTGPTVSVDAGDFDETAELGDAPSSASLAYVMYTSGSTGLPKGVMVAHGALMNYLAWAVAAYGFAADEAALLHTSPSFDLTVTSLFGPLVVGGSVSLAEEGRGIEPLTDALSRDRLGVVKLTPSHLELAAHAAPPRVFVVGGESVRRHHVDAWMAKTPRPLVFNEYGPTETVVGCAVHPVGPTEDDFIAIGRSAPGNALYVLDRHLQLVPPGVMGEIAIGGHQLARGYHARPALTAERFVPDPFSSEGARLYRTGDVGRYRADGVLECLGRLDRQVKVRGYRIELGEIEHALAAHPKVRAAAAVARQLHDGERQIAGYVVPSVDAEGNPPTEALRRFLAARLPEPMIPSSLTWLPSLPMTKNGKVDYAALPAPTLDSGRQEDFVPPRTEVERILERAWQRVLGSEGALGIHDDFFKVGGSSLRLAKLAVIIRELTGVQVPIRALYGASTIASQAALLKDDAAGSPGLAPSIGRRPNRHEYPLSFGQERMWRWQALAPDCVAYHVPLTLRIEGVLDVPALTRAVSRIRERHEILRSRVEERDGRLRQTIAPADPVTLPVADFSTLTEPARTEAAIACATREARRRFVFEEGVMRCLLLRLGSEEHVLVVVWHHMVADNRAVVVFLRELVTLYEAGATGRAADLPELPFQYADYAHWQRTRLSGAVRDELLSYWAPLLRDAPPFEMPTDHAVPAEENTPLASFPSETLLWSMPTRTANALAALAQKDGVTLSVVMMATLFAWFQRYSLRRDVCLTSSYHGHDRPETESLFGYFAGPLLLRMDLADDPSFAALVARTKNVVFGAIAHAEMPVFEAAGAPLELISRLHVVYQNDEPLGPTGPFHPWFPLPSDRLRGLYMFVSVMENSGDVTLSIRYNARAFDAQGMARRLEHYEELLARVVRDPTTRLSALWAEALA